MDEPALRVWMQEPVAPSARQRGAARPLGGRARPGRRPTIERAPHRGSARARSRDEPDPAAPRLEIGTDLLCGLDGGVWCADGTHGDGAVDQRADDGRALSFTSAPLDERIELLGNARVELELESDRPVAQLAARLCDVAPDGSSLLVTRGVLNLTHRDSHEHPQPLEPGRRDAHRARARRHRAGDPGRAPRASGALARVLAVAVAGAGAGHARRPHRGQLARAARAPAARRGRASSDRSTSPRARPDSSRRSSTRSRAPAP